MDKEEILKLIEEEFEVKRKEKPELEGRCCVEDPPESARDVLLIQEESSLIKEYTFKAYYDREAACWGIYGGGNGGYILSIPRSAMTGVRWVEED